MAWSCRMDIAMLLRGLQLDHSTCGLEFHLDQYKYSSVDIAISPTRRRRDHRCDSSSSCDPIASATDLVSAGATAHHHTKIRTFPAEGFRTTSIPKNRTIGTAVSCSRYYLPTCFPTCDAATVGKWPAMMGAPFGCPHGRSASRSPPRHKTEQ